MFKNYLNGGGVLGCWLALLVASYLVFNMGVGVGVSSRVEDGAAPTTLHKDRCHIVKGRFFSGSLDLLEMLTLPKITSAYCMHEVLHIHSFPRSLNSSR